MNNISIENYYNDYFEPYLNNNYWNPKLLIVENYYDLNKTATIEYLLTYQKFLTSKSTTFKITIERDPKHFANDGTWKIQNIIKHE